VLRADIDRLRGRLEVNVGSAAVAERLFSRAARAVAADDPERAAEMAVAAGLLRIYDPEAAHDRTGATLVLPGPTTTERPRMRTLRRLLDVQTADAEGRLPDALASLADAVEADASALPEPRPDDPGLRGPAPGASRTSWPISATPPSTWATTTSRTTATGGCSPTAGTPEPSPSCSTPCHGWPSPSCCGASGTRSGTARTRQWTWRRASGSQP
jgi:hypothetical protein